MRVLVLHDQIAEHARKDEADALVQADAVGEALRELGHEPLTLAASLDLDRLTRELRRIKPDMAFNLVESPGGHGRLIHVVPALLEALRIPFTGASSEAQFITSNKVIAKRMLRMHYLPTATWHTIDDLRDDEGSGQFVPARYIIKSVWEHASIGLDDDSVVTAESAWHLREAIENRLEKIGGEGFAEEYIDGREFNLAMLADELGPHVLPPAEIVFDEYRSGKPRVVGYRAKWHEDSFEYQHTPQRYDFSAADAPLIERLTAIALECWRLFGLSGYARVDFRVDELPGVQMGESGEMGGRPWVLEVNANPCLSPDAGFAAALRRGGIPFAQGIKRIIGHALQTQPYCPATPAASGR